MDSQRASLTGRPGRGAQPRRPHPRPGNGVVLPGGRRPGRADGPHPLRPMEAASGGCARELTASWLADALPRRRSKVPLPRPMATPLRTDAAGAPSFGADAPPTSASAFLGPRAQAHVAAPPRARPPS